MSAKLCRCIDIKDKEPTQLYFLENKYGEIITLTKEQVKTELSKGSLVCENLKITKDGKLLRCNHVKERKALFLKWLQNTYPELGKAEDSIVLCSSFADSLKVVVEFTTDNIKVIKYRFDSPMKPIVQTTLFDANSCRTLNEFEGKIADVMSMCKGINVLNTKERLQTQLKLVDNHINYLQEERERIVDKLKEMEDN